MENKGPYQPEDKFELLINYVTTVCKQKNNQMRKGLTKLYKMLSARQSLEGDLGMLAVIVKGFLVRQINRSGQTVQSQIRLLLGGATGTISHP